MALHTPVTLLVIDDEPAVRTALAQLLRRDGATVDTAADGYGALAHLQERHYDVILCDLRMPALDGPTFYAMLRKQYPALCQRVIFFTGDVLTAESIAFLEQSGQPWLPKPCQAAGMRQAITQVLRAAAPAQARSMAG